MKNIEKYPNTKDALKAYHNEIGLKKVQLEEWLELEYEEPRKPSLLEAAEAVTTAWFMTGRKGSLEVVAKKICALENALNREKAKPVRNCDTYRTAEDAHAGFIEFCRKYTCGKCRFNKGTPVGYAIEWLYGDAIKDDAK